MSGFWIAVASAEHVRRGCAGGFMQVCHGKQAPLRRVAPGSVVAYYSPTVTFGGNDRLQAFTAIGHVQVGEPYRFDMGDGFVPYRRNVSWWPAHDAPIAPLLMKRLSITRERPRWGVAFRFGLVSVTAGDMDLIAEAMGARRKPGPVSTSF